VKQSSDALRILLIGGGRMGIRHLRSAQFVPDIEIFGIVDSNTSTRLHLKKDGHFTFPNLAAALASGAFEAAIVATPPASLAPIAQELVLKGIHVLVEKPFVLDASFQDRTSARSENSRVVIQVGFVERFARFSAEIDRLLFSVANSSHQAADLATLTIRRSSMAPQWHTETDPLQDLACHDMDHLERNGIIVRSRTMERSHSRFHLLGDLWFNERRIAKLDARAQWSSPTERLWCLTRPTGLKEMLTLDASADFGTHWDPLARQLTEFRDSCRAARSNR
jgi:Oxidoreductase family, NAD-binding Rossmann fold